MDADINVRRGTCVCLHRRERFLKVLGTCRVRRVLKRGGWSREVQKRFRKGEPFATQKKTISAISRKWFELKASLSLLPRSLSSAFLHICIEEMERTRESCHRCLREANSNALCRTPSDSKCRLLLFVLFSSLQSQKALPPLSRLPSVSLCFPIEEDACNEKSAGRFLLSAFPHQFKNAEYSPDGRNSTSRCARPVHQAEFSSFVIEYVCTDRQRERAIGWSSPTCMDRENGTRIGVERCGGYQTYSGHQAVEGLVKKKNAGSEALWKKRYPCRHTYRGELTACLRRCIEMHLRGGGP